MFCGDGCFWRPRIKTIQNVDVLHATLRILGLSLHTVAGVWT